MRRRRKELGFSHNVLSQRIGYTRQYMSMAERVGRNLPSEAVVRAIDNALDARGSLTALWERAYAEQKSFRQPCSLPPDRVEYVLGNPASVDLVAVAQIQDRISQLDAAYDELPSTELVGAAGQVLGQVKHLHEHASGRVKKALFEVEAESATLMGQLVWDVSQRKDHTGPCAYLDQAVHASRQVRNPGAQAYAVLRKSFVALYGEQNPKKGLLLAQEAAETAASWSPSLTGLSLLHVAEGYAILGDRSACETALKKAETRADRVDGFDPSEGLYSMKEFNRLAGSCYLYLGLPERAEPLLKQTASMLSSKKKSQAIAFGNLTLSLIRQRKLDEAATTMHRAIDAVELTRGGGGLNLVFTAGQELQQWRTESNVQDINDRLFALMAA
ncbi:transcriptional regulator [Prauserella marina]|nr:transcriptional regulator [Prauserella marina]